MSDNPKPLSKHEYEKMAAELESMANTIQAHPEMNHHFAERLHLLARQMREDLIELRKPR